MAVASQGCRAKAATFPEFCVFRPLPSPPPTLKKTRPDAQTRDLARQVRCARLGPSCRPSLGRSLRRPYVLTVDGAEGAATPKRGVQLTGKGRTTEVQD